MKGYFVYKYVYKNEIIYIGKTTNLKRRVKDHLLDPSFSPYLTDRKNLSVFYFDCSCKEVMDIFEKTLIIYYKPILNTQIYKNWTVRCSSETVAEISWEFFETETINRILNDQKTTAKIGFNLPMQRAIEFLLLVEKYNNNSQFPTATVISKEMSISSVLLRQIMCELNEYVESKKGVGGITLKISLDNISIYDLLVCLEQDISLCQNNSVINKKTIDKIEEQLIEIFKTQTIGSFRN